MIMKLHSDFQIRNIKDVENLDQDHRKIKKMINY